MENNSVEKVFVYQPVQYICETLAASPCNMRLELIFCLFVLNNMYIAHSLATCQGNVIYQVNIFTVMSPCSYTNTMIKFLNQNQHMY